MNLPDTTAFLTWLSQTDHRIQVTDANIQVWSNALATIPTAAVKAAALEHYRTNETAAPSPAGLRKLALGARERELARQSALTAAPAAPDRTEASIRQRIMDTPEFRAAFERGRLEGNAERAYWTTIRETGDRTKAAAASNAARLARKDAR